MKHFKIKLKFYFNLIILVINVEAAQSYDTETILTKNEISNYADRFIINPTPTYQVQTQDQVMPYLPNNTLISNRSYFIENEIIY